MHLRSSIVPTFCIDITQQMDVKERAILAYESQFITPPRNRKVVDWLRQMNGYMGSRIGTDYAEPFYSREPLGLSGFESLVMGA
jgi:LmbE family N-acetylglucosaminyl deacetylase